MPYLLLILTTLFWSGNFVLSRGMHTDIPPLALSFWRWLTAMLLFAPFALPLLYRQRQVVLANWRFLSVQGLLGVAGFNSLIYLAMQTTTAINAVLVNSCTPVIIVVFSWLFYQDRLTFRQALGVLLSLLGVLLIISGGKPSQLLHLHFNRGDLFVLAAAAFWALYSANLKRYPANLHPFAYLMAIMIVGVATLFPLYLFEISSGVFLHASMPVLVTILYVAIFASLAAFIFWNRAVTAIGANRAAPFIHLMPVFSSILAIIFLGEAFTTNHALSILMIFSGILLATVRPKPSL